MSSVILPHMKCKVRMEGNVNGHSFTIEGDGGGEPYEGDQVRNLTVTKGGPLPFAYDILTSAFQYGIRVFTKYPSEIPDYFKQCFPAGMKWERCMMFEDGGVCTINSDIRLEGDCFVQEIQFNGVNFPSDGPVMQRQTQGWEPSAEKMYGRDGVLKGDVTMALKVGNGHYMCNFKSTYKANNPHSVKIPGHHFIDHRIEITKHDKGYNKIELKERAIARHTTLLPIV